MATTTKPKPVAKKAATKKAAPAPAAKATKTTKKAAPTPVVTEDTEKAAAKAAKAAETAARREAAEARRTERAEATEVAKAEVVRLRSEGMKWPEVASELGISIGRAQWFGAVAEGEAAGVKKATPALVKKDRDDRKMSWDRIAVQYGLNKSQAQALYREAGGDPHTTYIGRGGRYFSHEESVAAAKAAVAATKPEKSPKAEKATTGKATKAEKAAAGKPVFAADEDAATIVERISGKSLTIASGSTFKVKPGTTPKVGKSGKGDRVIQFTDAKNGGTRTIAVTSVIKVS